LRESRQGHAPRADVMQLAVLPLTASGKQSGCANRGNAGALRADVMQLTVLPPPRPANNLAARIAARRRAAR
jgi:hypothetical protein